MSPPVGPAARLTPEQIAWLHEELDGAPKRGVAADVARRFNERFGQDRDPNLVWNFRMQYGITTIRKHFWTKEQEGWLREFSEHFSKTELAEIFNRRFCLKLTRGAIGAKVRRLGLKLKYSGPAYDGGFRNAHTGGRPPGSGSKGPTSTSFRRGHVPALTRPVGSVRVCSKTGELTIRMPTPRRAQYWADGSIRSSHYFVARRIVVWETHHGPVPPNHKVIRLVNDVQDDRIEVLMCIHAGALAVLNHECPIRKLPEDLELRKVAVMAAVVKHRAGQRGRESE